MRILLLALTMAAGIASQACAADIDRKGVAVSTMLLMDDITEALLGHDAIVSSDDALHLANIDISTSAPEYSDTYDGNELAADKRFGGKRIVMLGSVRSISKDAFGKPYLALAGAKQFSDVLARLTDAGAERAMTLKKGGKVVLVCRGGGKIATSAVARDCRFLSQYLAETSTTLQKTIESFLAGDVALPKKAAQMVVFTYLMGVGLPDGSPCLTDAQKCGAELTKFSADKASDKRIGELLNRLKVQ